jgi:tRNA nucleotidyltransferase (CCA-adding enzyme)
MTRIAAWQPATRKTAIEDSSLKIYRVGGAIRDRLLGLPHQDSDWVVVGATAQEMIDQGYRPVGKYFPVFLHPETFEEYALARTERKTGPGYKGFEVHAAPDVTLEDDLKRRDLTINAIAESEDGQLIDPYGGQKDIEQRILRHISPAFAEDPVRILRVARLATRLAPLGFTIAGETMTLMKNMVAAGEVDALTAERVWTEMNRALGEERPTRFIEVLRQCDALGRLFPEIEALFGVPQRKDYHPEVDSGVHTMMVLERAAQLSGDVEIRFAALVHDLGKGTTPKDQWPRHEGHEERSVDLIKNLCKRYRIPNEFRDLAVIVARYHSHCHRLAELRPGTILQTLEALDAFRRPQRFKQFLVACKADSQGRLGQENNPYPQAAWFSRAFEVARNVGTAALLQAGLQGEKLGEILHQKRVEAIARALQPVDKK